MIIVQQYLIPVILLIAAGSAHAACEAPIAEPGIRVQATQLAGRADVEIERPRGGGQRVRVDYGEDTFSMPLDASGRARLSFALLAPSNRFTVYLKEAAPIKCALDVPDFDSFYRVVLTWTDPVQLDLHVIEPGRAMGGFGSLNRDRPNRQGNDGDGQIDIAITPTEEGSSGQISYVVARPSDTTRTRLYSFRMGYPTRGATPQPPYCDEHSLADVPAQLTILDRGQVQRRSYATGRAQCGEALADARRLMPLRH